MFRLIVAPQLSIQKKKKALNVMDDMTTDTYSKDSIPVGIPVRIGSA